MASDTVLIYGAGAVGALIGGRLAATGTPVTLLGRPGLRQAIEERGLQIEMPGGTQQVNLPVIGDVKELEAPPDLVLLAVKAYDVEGAIPDLRRLAESGAVLVTLQNGVGTEEELAPIAPHLVAGSFTLSVASPEPGVVRQETAGGGLTLARVQGEVRLAPLVERLGQAGIPPRVVPDYQQLKWSKLLLNILGNATAAVLALPPAEIYDDLRLFHVERAAFLEALAVMRAMKRAPMALPGFNVPLLARVMRLPAPLSRRLLASRASSGRGDKLPSLLLDIERGRNRTEVDWLNGAVVSAGRRLEVPVPVNAALTALVREVAADPARRRELAGNREALLEMVEAKRGEG